MLPANWRLQEKFVSLFSNVGFDKPKIWRICIDKRTTLNDSISFSDQ